MIHRRAVYQLNIAIIRREFATALQILDFSEVPPIGGNYMPNRYDYRVRNAIVETGNPNLFPELCIPSSTAHISTYG